MPLAPHSWLGPILFAEAAVELFLSVVAAPNIVQNEADEVGVAVGYDRLLDRFARVFSRPYGLTGRSVAIQPGAGCGYPVTQALPCIDKVAVPAQWGRAVLVRVLGAQPVQVQCR